MLKAKTEGLVFLVRAISWKQVCRLVWAICWFSIPPPQRWPTKWTRGKTKCQRWQDNIINIIIIKNCPRNLNIIIIVIMIFLGDTWIVLDDMMFELLNYRSNTSWCLMVGPNLGWSWISNLSHNGCKNCFFTLSGCHPQLWMHELWGWQKLLLILVKSSIESTQAGSMMRLKHTVVLSKQTSGKYMLTRWTIAQCILS